MNRDTLILTASDVRQLLSMRECIDAVEHALALHARGKTPPPGVLGVHVSGGGFHLKAAAAQLNAPYFAAKTNGNFPGNPASNGLPSIQGVLVLCHAENGRPLAVIDSIEVTTLRTGAATAVAARYLARENSAVATIVGCGVQGRAQLRALAEVRALTSAFGVDTDAARAVQFAAEMSRELNLEVRPETSLRAATANSDIVVTCTPSSEPVLSAADVRPGTFVAAVGADNPDKQELDTSMFIGHTIVVDELSQCAAFGDLKHAIDVGVIEQGDVHGQLGEVIVGTVRGRRDEDEIIVFDSTGTALQDVAAAAIVYERAVETGRGLAIGLAS